jgi:RNA polymerase sigma-70 factor (ECF subfamily)
MLGSVADAEDVVQEAKLRLLKQDPAPDNEEAFLLREGFDYSFDEIGKLIGVSAPACRQRFRRARANLRDERRAPTPAAEQRDLLDRLILAIAEDDLVGLVKMFSEDTVVLSDGGGIVSAAIRPVTGPQRIAQLLMHLSRNAAKEATLTHEFVELNGGIGVVTRLYVMRNPAKLGHLVAAAG